MKKTLLKKSNQSFTKGQFWTKTMALLLFFTMLSATKANAQIPITVQNNTNTTPNLAASYTSLADALTALNAVTAMTGPVILTSGTGSETAPVKGFTIGSATLNPVLSATNRVYIYGSTGFQSVIIAGVGIATPADASPDGMVKLIGADYISFEGFLLQDNNTTNPATMEFGIALFKRSTTDGCNNNTIHGNKINMQRINNVAGAGAMPAGVSAIIMINATATAATILLTPGAPSGANSNNKVSANIIDGTHNGIYFSGYTGGASPYFFADYNNIIGGSIANANQITNFGGGDGGNLAATFGITVNYQWNISVTYNNINNNTGLGVNHKYSMYGIFSLLGSINNNVTISNNIIKLQSDSTANYIIAGINNNAGNGTGTVNINDNMIQLGAVTNTGLTRGIYNSAVPAFTNINNNTIEGIAGQTIGGADAMFGISNSAGTISPTVNTNNNTIKNFDKTGTGGTFYGFQIKATNWICNNNSIDNIKFSSAGSTGNIYAINASASTVNATITNNIIKNLAIPATGFIYGIFENGAVGNKTIRGNQIFNFSTTTGGGGGSSYRGVSCVAGTVEISNNNIYTLNSSGTNVAASSMVSAIYLSSAANTLFNNKIYDLSAASSGGNIWAVYISSGTNNIYNNVISDLRVPNSGYSTSVIAFLFNSGGSLYHNTVLLNETVKNGLNSSSAAVQSSGGNLILRNNIFINKSFVNGAGKAIALVMGNYATTYDTSSNNNLLSAGTIFTDGSVNDVTLEAFKTRMVTRDQNSVTEANTPFISTLGSDGGFLRLGLNANSIAENNAVLITTPNINTDYFGITRPFISPVNGGTMPDIGASEFDGKFCPVPVAYTVTGGGNGCATTGVPVGLSNSETGVNYQLKLNGTATGSLIAGTGASFTLGNQTVAGTYTIDATSNVVGCNIVVAMTGSAVVTISPDITATQSQTNVSCFGGSNGTATVVASGGTGSFNYSWSPSGGNAATATGLTAGNYTCTITNANGCTATSNFIITQPPAITATQSQTNISCFGGSNGTATVNASGITGPFFYSWSPSGGNAATASGLTAGNYTCTITDNNSCTTTRNFVITQPNTIIMSASQTNVSCFGGSNGTATVSVNGGTPGYTYNWTPGNPTGNGTASVTGLSAGNYTCTVTDSNGCTATRNFTISQSGSLNITAASQTNVACNGGSNGAASVNNVFRGFTYTYDWSPGTPAGDGTTSVTGLTAGIWSCTVTQSTGCAETLNFTITEPTAIAAAQLQTNVSCFGGTNGTASVTASGGVSPYTYSWSNGPVTSSVTGLAEGSYICRITDSNGCMQAFNFTITQPTAITGTQSQTNVSCFGGSNGTASVNASGGTGTFTYSWSPSGGTNATASGLIAGNYTCTITDANGCIATRTFTISQAAPLNVTAASQTNVSCNGGSTGAASVNNVNRIIQGTPTSYNWSPGTPAGDGTTSITGLTAGTWSCTVTNYNGCTETLNFTITEPAAIVATQSQTNVSCFGGTNGSAGVTASGGVAPYTYSWSNGPVTSSVTGLAAGSYICRITDNNGCMQAFNFTITQPAAVDNSVSQASGVLSAVQNGATYQWFVCPNAIISGANNQNFTPTATGDYKVEVTLSGCTVTSSCITVTNLGTDTFDFNSKISVYPNPSKDVFSVNSDTRGSIVIYDLIGKTIKSENMDLGITKLDLSKYPSGIYLMKVTNHKNQTKNIKLIKQ